MSDSTYLCLICDNCGRQILDEDPHYPHDRDCIDRETCRCDNSVHDACCWEPECVEDSLQTALEVSAEGWDLLSSGQRYSRAEGLVLQL